MTQGPEHRVGEKGISPDSVKAGEMFWNTGSLMPERVAGGGDAGCWTVSGSQSGRALS